jgi:hypothetical protein
VRLALEGGYDAPTAQAIGANGFRVWLQARVGNIQGIFREHLGNIQVTFREYSGNIVRLALEGGYDAPTSHRDRLHKPSGPTAFACGFRHIVINHDKNK